MLQKLISILRYPIDISATARRALAWARRNYFQSRWKLAQWLDSRRREWVVWSRGHTRLVAFSSLTLTLVLLSIATWLALPLAANVELPLPPIERCYGLFCFVPQQPATAGRIFGFAEFLAALALMVIVWTIADVQYRFRVAVAPGSIYRTTFFLMVAVGIATLATDLWTAQLWWVPRTWGLTYSLWQFTLGLLFFGTFVTWVWYAFVRPPIFGWRNARRFAQALYRVILKGSPTDLPVIADELARSAKSIIRYATERRAVEFQGLRHGDKTKNVDSRTQAEGIADDILLLIADRKFCRHVVASSQITALALFQEIVSTRKHGVQIGTFARNITNEALRNRDSFLFHEVEGYETGLIGYHKPLSQAMYGNFQLVEAQRTMLDPDYATREEWDALQWQAFCRVVLLVLRDYAVNGGDQHSFVLFGAQSKLENAASDLYTIDGMQTGGWNSQPAQRLNVVVEYVKEAIKILNEAPIKHHRLRRRKDDKLGMPDFYDDIAELICKVLFWASKVTKPRDLCWTIQHNSTWGDLFNFGHMEGPAAEIIAFKVRRKLYEDIAHMGSFPNFKGSSLLGLLLNVMGLELRKEGYSKDTYALHQAVLKWTKRHYAWLHGYNPRVAEDCLVEGITYDPVKNQLVRIYPVEGLRREPRQIALQLDPPTPPNPLTPLTPAKPKQAGAPKGKDGGKP